MQNNGKKTSKTDEAPRAISGLDEALRDPVSRRVNWMGEVLVLIIDFSLKVIYKQIHRHTNSQTLNTNMERCESLINISVQSIAVCTFSKAVLCLQHRSQTDGLLLQYLNSHSYFLEIVIAGLSQ